MLNKFNNNLMKKYSLLTVLIIIFSCNSKIKETKGTQIGIEISDKGERLDLNAGKMSTVTIWENYIDAHNKRNIETIKSMNAQEFKAYGPRGEFIDGSEAHAEFLSVWFKDNQPKWRPKYYIANEVEDDKGNLMQWVTSGHDVTLTVDSLEVNVVQVHDALIKNGKIQKFYVYERAKQDSE